RSPPCPLRRRPPSARRLDRATTPPTSLRPASRCLGRIREDRCSSRHDSTRKFICPHDRFCYERRRRHRNPACTNFTAYFPISSPQLTPPVAFPRTSLQDYVPI